MANLRWQKLVGKQLPFLVILSSTTFFSFSSLVLAENKDTNSGFLPPPPPPRLTPLLPTNDTAQNNTTASSPSGLLAAPIQPRIPDLPGAKVQKPLQPESQVKKDGEKSEEKPWWNFSSPGQGTNNTGTTQNESNAASDNKAGGQSNAQTSDQSQHLNIYK